MKEEIAPAETGQESVAPTKALEKRTVVALTPEFKAQILGYLESRPYKEVAHLVDSLKKTVPFELTFNGKEGNS